MRQHIKEKRLLQIVQIAGLLDRASLLLEELRKEISGVKTKGAQDAAQSTNDADKK
jgi:hypothetical protein